MLLDLSQSVPCRPIIRQGYSMRSTSFSLSPLFSLVCPLRHGSSRVASVTLKCFPVELLFLFGGNTRTALHTLSRFLGSLHRLTRNVSSRNETASSPCASAAPRATRSVSSLASPWLMRRLVYQLLNLLPERVSNSVHSTACTVL